MFQLILAASFFLGLHFGVAGTRLRLSLIDKFGMKTYHAIFGAVSLLGLFWLFHAYRTADYIETWGQLAWFKPIAAVIMLFAFLFVVIGLFSRNVEASKGNAPAFGIQRITRHPILFGGALLASPY